MKKLTIYYANSIIDMGYGRIVKFETNVASLDDAKKIVATFEFVQSWYLE